MGISNKYTTILYVASICWLLLKLVDDIGLTFLYREVGVDVFRINGANVYVRGTDAFLPGTVKRYPFRLFIV